MDKRANEVSVSEVECVLDTTSVHTLNQFELAVVGGGIGDTVL